MIRSGHGASYSVLGTIPNGATVYVSKASGTGANDWGHVEYNGISGYASMAYLKPQGAVPAESPTIRWWLSETEYGEPATEIKVGNRYYFCYRLYDKVTGKDWDEVSTNSYSVHLAIYNPDGSLNYENTDYCDTSWISIFYKEPGTYTRKVVVSGDFTFSSSTTYTVAANPKMIHATTNSVNLVLGDNFSEEIYIWTSGYHSNTTVLSWERENANISCAWGEWTEDGLLPLTIIAKSEGNSSVTLSVKDKESGSVLHSIVVNISVTSKKYSISYDANGGSYAPATQQKSHDIDIALSTEIPERTGYTFLGWSASPYAASATYLPGGVYASNENITLYAVWQSAIAISPYATDNSYSAEILFGGGHEFYTFTPSQTAVYRIESTGSQDTQIYVYDSNGNLLVSNDDGGTGRNFLLDFKFTAGTKYYIKVRLYSSASIGTIDFAVKRIYNISYNANGGTDAPSSQAKVHGTSVTLSSVVPQRSGYIFLGWSTNPSATTHEFLPDAVFTDNVDTVLYAVWKQKVITIISQPMTAYSKQGEIAKTTVEAEGDGLTYQWYIKNLGADSYTKSSVTASTYSCRMTESAHNRSVYCIITDAYGNTVRTQTVRLRMAATVTNQPKTTYTKLGATAKATVEAVGEGLSYQWYIKNVGATKYSKSSITSATYSCKMADASKDRLVYCVVTDAYGNTARTETVRLRMAATVTTEPVSVRVADGKKATVELSAVGDGLQYKWYYKDAGASEFTLTTSFTGNSYYVTMNSARAGRQVYCVVTDKYGNSDKTNTVTLSMKTDLQITTQPKTSYAQSGKIVSVTVKAQGTGLKYQWYVKNADGTTYSKSSITGPTYSTIMTTKVHGRRVYCVITDAAGNKVTSNTAMLRLSVSVKTQPTDVTVASGAKASTTVTAIGYGLTYQWYVCDEGSTEFIKSAITTKTYSCTMNADRDGREVYCIITDQYGKSVKTRTVVLSMK